MHPCTLPVAPQENAALRERMDAAAVEVLSAQADLAVARQGAGGLELDLRVARREAAAAGEREGAARLEQLQLQVRGARLAEWVQQAGPGRRSSG